MTMALDVITRGTDTSGRQLKGTRQSFQFFDQLNEGAAKGLLVLIQGGWSFAAASANTHGLGMCQDYRTWNLTASVREAVVIQGRNMMGTMWYRTEEDGFDPHFHNNIIGDYPATISALSQVVDYKRGLNGLANKRLDRNPFRPKLITGYKYLEDDMFDNDDKKRLERIEKLLEQDKKRDLRKIKGDQWRFQRLVAEMGKQVDALTLMINNAKDDATKRDLKKVQEKILLTLKEDPDVTKEDNPSDEGMAERNMG